MLLFVSRIFFLCARASDERERENARKDKVGKELFPSRLTNATYIYSRVTTTRFFSRWIRGRFKSFAEVFGDISSFRIRGIIFLRFVLRCEITRGLPCRLYLLESFRGPKTPRRLSWFSRANRGKACAIFSEKIWRDSKQMWSFTLLGV